VALKSIDRVDIVNMMEGQGPPTGQQGGWEQEASRSRHHERDHLSPAITNGKRHSTLHLSHIMLFSPQRTGFPSHPVYICCCIFLVPLYLGHEPNISSSNSAVTRTRTDDTPPELCYIACLNVFLTTAGKCSQTLQRPPLLLLKLGKYLRLRRFACVF